MDIYQVFLKLSYHAEPNPKHYLWTFIGIFFGHHFCFQTTQNVDKGVRYKLSEFLGKYKRVTETTESMS